MRAEPSDGSSIGAPQAPLVEKDRHRRRCRHPRVPGDRGGGRPVDRAGRRRVRPRRGVGGHDRPVDGSRLWRVPAVAEVGAEPADASRLECRPALAASDRSTRCSTTAGIIAGSTPRRRDGAAAAGRAYAGRPDPQQADRFPAGSRNLYLVQRMLDQYLPSTLDAYLALPPGASELPITPDRRTGAQVLRAQLDILEAKLDEAAEDLRQVNVDRLLANERFLEEHFGRPSQSELRLPQERDRTA